MGKKESSFYGLPKDRNSILCGLLEGRGAVVTAVALWEKREQKEGKGEADLRLSYTFSSKNSACQRAVLQGAIVLSHVTMSS